MQYLVFYSGGILSYATLRVLLTQVPKESIRCLFTDTSTEDPDLYRFVVETINHFDVPLVWLKEGRDIWQVMRDHKFLANSRFDVCSRVLKRDPAAKYLKTHGTPGDMTLVFGMDWSESERVTRLQAKWEPQGYSIYCPLAKAPYHPYETYFKWLEEDGIPTPSLYKHGFTHNNCGGFCVKAGLKHFRHLLTTFPERYAYHERQEKELLNDLRQKETYVEGEKGRGLLKVQVNKFRRFVTLEEFRLMNETPEEETDVGTCGCFLE